MNSIEVENLTKRFQDKVAVDHISFHVEQGELFGFLGVNGAGKSTTINMLCSLLKKTDGKAIINGYELGREDEDIRKGIGVLFQGNTLDARLTVSQNLSTRACLYEKNAKKRKENLNYIYEVLNIENLLNQKFKDLSGGQKRRCEIARALINRPKILFLDEPTTGLDPMTRQIVWNVIEQMRQEFGMTVFLTTHYMEEAVKANHIGVMDAGKLIEYASPYELKNKYSYDQLRLFVDNQEQLITDLYDRGFQSLNKKLERMNEYIMIPLNNTMESFPILNLVKEKIKAYEVIQGTMDDVFLTITGKQLD